MVTWKYGSSGRLCFIICRVIGRFGLAFCFGVTLENIQRLFLISNVSAVNTVGRRELGPSTNLSATKSSR